MNKVARFLIVAISLLCSIGITQPVPFRTHETLRSSGSPKDIWSAIKSASDAEMTGKSDVIKSYKEYLNKNRTWIEDQKKINQENRQIIIERYKKNPNWMKQKGGGVTDGGGNQIDGTLFDFWVATGTLEVSFSDLLKWNSELRESLEFMTSLSPSSNEIGYIGWVEEIMLIGKKQRWIFDPKPINNVDCWNLSPNISPFQEVMGCNSVSEVRIYAPAFFGQSDLDEHSLAQFQAGFILHELLLSWAREKFGIKMRKLDLEVAVQRINESIRRRQNVTETIRTYIPVNDFIIASDIKLLEEIKRNLFLEGAKLCAGSEITRSDYFSAAVSRPLVKRYLGRQIVQFVKAARTRETAEEKLHKNIFCHEAGFYQDIETKSLSLFCRKTIERHVEMQIAETIERQGILSIDLVDKFSLAHVAAQQCYDSVRIGDSDVKADIYLQALEYFKKWLQKFKTETQSPFDLPNSKG